MCTHKDNQERLVARMRCATRSKNSNIPHEERAVSSVDCAAYLWNASSACRYTCATRRIGDDDDGSSSRRPAEEGWHGAIFAQRKRNGPLSRNTCSARTCTHHPFSACPLRPREFSLGARARASILSHPSYSSHSISLSLSRFHAWYL